MGAGDVFVGVGPPARASGDSHVAIFDGWHGGRQLVFPGHVVDVDLHDAHVRQHGAQIATGERRQVAVGIVNLLKIAPRRLSLE
jgi:hypothetical protein